jgi:hypothetical protein
LDRCASASTSSPRSTSLSSDLVGVILLEDVFLAGFACARTSLGEYKTENWQVRLRKVYTRAPQAFDEKVARLHLGALWRTPPETFGQQSRVHRNPMVLQPDTYRY